MTTEQRLREALAGLLAHCGEQGWWMEVHAIQVMDEARAALALPIAAPADEARDAARWRHGASGAFPEYDGHNGIWYWPFTRPIEGWRGQDYKSAEDAIDSAMATPAGTE